MTPDLVPATGWTFNLSGTAGKVALFSDQVTGRTCATAQSSGMLVDLVGYGTANCYETANAPACDVSSVLVRVLDGAVDTDDNSVDFSKVAGAWPLHNSASAQNPQCRQAPPDAPALVGPLDGATGVAVPATLTVTVSDPDADSLTVQFYGRAVPPPPAAPVATAATSVTSSGFTANWNASAGATSYRLDVSTDSGFGSCVVGYQDLAVTGSSRTVAGLTAETPYHYRVRAVNSGGTSDYSNPITVTTSAAGSGPFTLVLIPDTQFYTAQTNGGTMAMYTAQTQWIVRQPRRAATSPPWRTSATSPTTTRRRSGSARDGAHDLLEDPATTGLADGIPYVMNIGNHDDNGAARVQPVLRHQPVLRPRLLRRALGQHHQRRQLHPLQRRRAGLRPGLAAVRPGRDLGAAGLGRRDLRVVSEPAGIVITPLDAVSGPRLGRLDEPGTSTTPSRTGPTSSWRPAAT